jgi:GT2 family glycosyltransferase
MSQSPQVISIVLNWNGLQNTEACLRSLRDQTYPRVDVLVIDNGSTDRSGAQLATHQPTWWQLLRLPVNRGFAGGMNAGLRIARERGFNYVWLVNNDAFPEPDCLERLIGVMESETHLGMATPRLLDPSGQEQHAGARLCWSNGDNTPLLSCDLTKRTEKGIWLTGTALLLRASALASVGLFDSRFFAYWEDVDLSVRITNSGYDLRAVPEANCVHLGSASTGGVASPLVCYLSVRNALYFLRKHLSLRRVGAAWLGFASNWLERSALMSLRGQRTHAIAVIRGMFAALLGETGKPIRYYVPAPFESLALQHPWRLNILLRLLHRMV